MNGHPHGSGQSIPGKLPERLAETAPRMTLRIRPPRHAVCPRYRALPGQWPPHVHEQQYPTVFIV